VAPTRVPEGLGVLEYPGFVYLKRHADRLTPANPAQLVLTALQEKDLDPRVAEALPWVLARYPNLDWDWLVPQVKMHDLQNRLGFLVSLARTLAERHQDARAVAMLVPVEEKLESSRLAKEDTVGRGSMTQAERRWLQAHRPALAARWNVLSSLTPEQLSDGR
jgi:hypothetical protein